MVREELSLAGTAFDDEALMDISLLLRRVDMMAIAPLLPMQNVGVAGVRAFVDIISAKSAKRNAFTALIADDDITLRLLLIFSFRRCFDADQSVTVTSIILYCW